MRLFIVAMVLCGCGAVGPMEILDASPNASPDGGSDSGVDAADTGPDVVDADTCGSCTGPGWARCSSCAQAQRCGYTPQCSTDGGWLDAQ